MASLHIIECGTFKLDGGAMFGVVPKSLWNRLNPADENNLCTWALRCLLLETDERLILFDTGVGTKQGDKFLSHFHPEGELEVLSSVRKKGFEPEDITDVFLTHFHFDHVGGAVVRDDSGRLVPAFPNAVYWTSERHYRWALNPNIRERASFLKENFVPLAEHDVLRYIPEEQDYEWLEGIRVRYYYGHTEAMMVPVIPFEGRKLVFCSDLLPSVYHVRMPYVMAYDIRPLVTLEEKRRFFEEAIEEDYLLFLEHDPGNTLCCIEKNEKGRYAGQIIEHRALRGIS